MSASWRARRPAAGSASRSTPSRAGPGVADAAEGDRHRSRGEVETPGRQPGGGGRRAATDRVRKRLVGDPVQVRGDGVGEAVDPQLDPVVERETRVLAEVLDGPLE